VLCDGNHGRALPIAQDHKRIGEGDTGPNTGGMGAYAPAPTQDAAGCRRDEAHGATFVQPVLDHLRARARPTSACSTPG
jgi:phosphoribosylamine---glycine ligase